MSPGMGTVTEADVRAAQTTLDSILEYLKEHEPTFHNGLELRGQLSAAFADVRTAGYLEGVQRGRQEAAHVVLDALRGEGLLITYPPSPGEGW